MHRRDRSAEAPRPNAGQRGYGASWRRIRDDFIKRHPYCADIYFVHGERKVPTMEVDHIISRRKGGTDVDSNLQGLCGLCHRRKTSRVDNGGWPQG